MLWNDVVWCGTIQSGIVWYYMMLGFKINVRNEVINLRRALKLHH